MTSQDYKFEGWLAEDASAANGSMKWKEFEPKEWEETDVDIKVTHCGICGSDLHTLRSGWVCEFSRFSSSPLLTDMITGTYRLSMLRRP